MTRSDDQPVTNPSPGPSILHDFDCTYDPCRCAPIDPGGIVTRMQPTDELREAAERALPLTVQEEVNSDDMTAVVAAVLAIVERDRPDPAEAMRAAYWKLRGHASSYRSTPLFARRQESFRLDPDNAIFARGATRDEWYARGIEAAADDLAELLELEYDVHIDPDPDAPAPAGQGDQGASEHGEGVKPVGYCANCVERCEGLHRPCFEEVIGCTEDFRPDDVHPEVI